MKIGLIESKVCISNKAKQKSNCKQPKAQLELETKPTSNTLFNQYLYCFIRQMPGLVAIKNSESAYLYANELCAKLAGYKTIESFIGTKDYDWKCEAVEFADKIRWQDKYVLETQKSLKSFNILKFSTGVTYYLSNRSLLYSPDGKALGIIFIGTILTDISLIKALNFIVQGKFISSSKKCIRKNAEYNIYSIIDANHSKLMLSARQEECLFYILRCRSCKEIAKILKISHRTVETYIEQIKYKFKCATKSELFEKAIDMGFFYRIPLNLLEKTGLVENL